MIIIGAHLQLLPLLRSFEAANHRKMPLAPILPNRRRRDALPRRIGGGRPFCDRISGPEIRNGHRSIPRHAGFPTPRPA
jgi:hypothetical protein